MASIVGDGAETDLGPFKVVANRKSPIGADFFFNGEKCVPIHLTSRLAKQLAGWKLIDEDLREAQLWFSELFASELTPDNRWQKKAYFIAAVTTYGRCTAQADGRAAVLEQSQLARENRPLHRLILRVRNQFTAHAGTGVESHRTLVIAVPSQVERLPPDLQVHRQQPIGLTSLAENDSTGLRAENVTKLINDARSVAQKRTRELSDLVYEREIVGKGPTHWRNTVDAARDLHPGA